MNSMSAFSTLGIRRIREANLSRTLSMIHRSGTISRADIARETGLSATTVSLIVKALLESGFVRESGTGESRGGRPPILVEFNYTFRYLLGIDMGATHLTVVLMNLGGEVSARRHQDYDVTHNPAGTVATMLELVEDTLTSAGQSLDTVLGLGIAVPAPLEGEHLDRPSTVVLPEWEGFDLIVPLQSALCLPIAVENDANAGAIAEKWWGRGSDHENLAYIKLSTGVGSGLITGGAIYRGSGGTAGEIGHTPIDLDGPTCRCGKRGCLESFIGAPALVSRVAAICADDGPTTAELQNIKAIIAAAQAGDDRCREVLEQAGRDLGVGIANLLNLFNPSLIVLGGDLAAAGDFFLAAVRGTVRERAMPKAAQEAEICFSDLSDDAVAIGAATVALEYAFKPANLSRIIEA